MFLFAEYCLLEVSLSICQQKSALAPQCSKLDRSWWSSDFRGNFCLTWHSVESNINLTKDTSIFCTKLNQSGSRNIFFGSLQNQRKAYNICFSFHQMLGYYLGLVRLSLHPSVRQTQITHIMHVRHQICTYICSNTCIMYDLCYSTNISFFIRSHIWLVYYVL